jgi:hypothetical protein
MASDRQMKRYQLRPTPTQSGSCKVFRAPQLPGDPNGAHKVGACGGAVACAVCRRHRVPATDRAAGYARLARTMRNELWRLKSASASWPSPSQRTAARARVSLRKSCAAIRRLAIGSAGTTATRPSTRPRAARCQPNNAPGGRAKRRHSDANPTGYVTIHCREETGATAQPTPATRTSKVAADRTACLCVARWLPGGRRAGRVRGASSVRCGWRAASQVAAYRSRSRQPHVGCQAIVRPLVSSPGSVRPRGQARSSPCRRRACHPSPRLGSRSGRTLCD